MFLKPNNMFYNWFPTQSIFRMEPQTKIPNKKPSLGSSQQPYRSPDHSSAVCIHVCVDCGHAQTANS